MKTFTTDNTQLSFGQVSAVAANNDDHFLVLQNWLSQETEELDFKLFVVDTLGNTIDEKIISLPQDQDGHKVLISPEGVRWIVGQTDNPGPDNATDIITVKLDSGLNVIDVFAFDINVVDGVQDVVLSGEDLSILYYKDNDDANNFGLARVNGLTGELTYSVEIEDLLLECPVWWRTITGP
ncbi:hypothetical protein CEQ90_08730 [Lewinellaceae bacterium SD302]|nr:hypothetical protein CEQ90_08730 [Lewinellaceae bacterium SD302]